MSAPAETPVTAAPTKVAKTPKAPKAAKTVEAPAAPKVVVKKAKKVRAVKKNFTIDATVPVQDEIFDIAAYETFLNRRIKVDGKTGKLAGKVAIVRTGSKIAVNAEINFSKRYLKYLTKKFLKFATLRDYLRVIATSKNNYSIVYYGLNAEEPETSA